MSKLEHYGPWAMVTGASDGIGRAVAQRAASEGFNVLLAARSEAKLIAFADELRRVHGVQARAVGWAGVPGEANYAATKAYVQTLAEGLHRELKPRGVDVLAAAPGPVHTGFADRAGMTMRSAATPETVATATWAALGRRTTVVPGALAKVLTAAVKSLPRGPRSAILGRVMASMRG